MNPDHLRAAIERIGGIEKPSDVTLVMEEVGRMEAEERLVERVARAIFRCDGAVYTDDDRMFEPYPYEELDEIETAGFEYRARSAIEASGLLSLLTASEAFIREAERMGYGKTSEKALPGSFDLLVKAVREVKG